MSTITIKYCTKIVSRDELLKTIIVLQYFAHYITKRSITFNCAVFMRLLRPSLLYTVIYST